MKSTVIEKVLAMVAEDKPPNFFIKANTQELELAPARQILLEFLRLGGKSALSEDNILAYYRKINKLSAAQPPQVSAIQPDTDDLDIYKEHAAEYFESAGKNGDRWHFQDETINQFFIRICEIACRTFHHRFDLNDLYHGHLVYIESLQDVCVVFHAKEAPQDSVIRKADANVEKLWNKGGRLFDYQEMGQRNIIYLLKSNIMAAYSSDYSAKDQDDLYKEFDEAATGGETMAADLASHYIEESNASSLKIQDSLESAQKKIYAARSINIEALGVSMGDFNILRDAGLRFFDDWVKGEGYPQLFTQEVLFYFLTGKSAPGIYQQKILDKPVTPAPQAFFKLSPDLKMERKIHAEESSLPRPGQ